jgi:hypothetical protein
MEAVQRVYDAYFVDDLHPDDVRRFLDASLPPPPVFVAAQVPVSPRAPTGPAHHHGGPGLGAQAREGEARMLVLHRGKWRTPADARSAEQMRAFVSKRGRLYESNGRIAPACDGSPHPPFAFPPVWIAAEEVKAAGLRVRAAADIPGGALANDTPVKPLFIVDSPMTLFYNADQTELAPHTVVPPTGLTGY